MPLRRLTLIIIIVTSLALAGTLYAVSRIIIMSSFSELETTYVTKNVERVMDALAYDVSALNLKAADWAEWDDTHVFVEDLNQHYIKENLTDETFQIIRANLLLFLDNDGKVRHQQGFDLIEAKHVDLDQSDVQTILQNPKLSSHSHEKSFTAGVVALAKGPMLVASRPILNSQHSGPVKGTLVMGRYLDAAELEQMSKRVHAELAILGINDAVNDGDFKQAAMKLRQAPEHNVFPLSESEIAGFGLIKDVSGEPSFVVRVLMPRDITKHGSWTTTYLLTSLIIVTAVFGLVTLVVLEKVMINRLLSLETQLRSISQSNRTDLRVTVSGSDEITKVAVGINHALESLEAGANELRNSRDTIHALLNASSDAAVLMDRNGRFLAMNDATATALGSSKDALIGRNPLEYFPEETSKIRRAKFFEVISAGKSISFEDTNGDKVFHHNFNPVISSDGTVDKVAIFSRNVTDEKRTQQLLIEGARLKAIGEMASGVAHNFNNILDLVIGTAQTGEMQLERGRIAQTMESLKKISTAAQLGAQTVRRLQDFAKSQDSSKSSPTKLFDLTKTVQSALEMTVSVWKTNPLKEGIKIEVETDLRQDCFICGRENEIFEVIINMIKNAVEAMPSGGKISLKTAGSDTNILFQISDTGIGIDENDLEKVFTPFWSTKGFGGTGMGLASSYGIIRSHGGELTVDSVKGSGATFTFVIPKSSV